MESTIDFEVNTALKECLSDPRQIATGEADAALLACEDEDDTGINDDIVNEALDPIIDAVAANPEALLQCHVFDSLQFLLKAASRVSRQSLSKVFDLIISGLAAEGEVIGTDLEGSDDANVVHAQRRLLEMYAFLLQWAIAAVETKTVESSTVTTARSRIPGKGSKTKANKSTEHDAIAQLKMSMETMCRIMKLKLVRIFVTTSERDTFVSMFTRSVYLVLENEQHSKDNALRMHAFKVLCVAIKHHGHAFGAQTSIIQNLSYYEHLPEPMAELLHILAEQYDYPQLTDEILRDLSGKEFNNNDTRGPKSISAFLIKLSELAPRLVIKQMTLLVKQLDSDAYTLRCAVIDVCGNLIIDLSKQEDRNENTKTQINAFFDLLEERFLDINPYCRCRALQVYVKLCDLEQKFPKRRQAVAELAVQSLEDKSSNVRRNAIKLLAKLISTHPFSVMHGGLLSHEEWTTRLQAVDQQLEILLPTAEMNGEPVDTALLDEPTKIEDTENAEAHEQKLAIAMQDAATSEALTKLQLTRKYYLEAIRFIKTLHAAGPVICQLLSSKNKSEVIEAMDFFVIVDAYKLEAAKTGIRRMLRLIWTKGNSDEGKGVQAHLIECYRGLFFTAPETFDENGAANFVSRNMISLTFGATPAELTSLEQLLQVMVQAGYVSSLVITKLWQIYGVQKQEISSKQRRGAVVILGMLATADSDIVTRELSTMLNIGLGVHGQQDLMLARYTCVALQRMRPAKSTVLPRFPQTHAVVGRLAAMVEHVTNDKEWLGVAEQAIGAIYVLSEQPDAVCSAILRRKIAHVFPTDDEMQDGQSPGAALAQLLFIVGHIAIKQIVYLEHCESELKRRRAEKDRARETSSMSPSKKAAGDDQELDLIGGTSEDDITDTMAHVREQQLLFDKKSLLTNFGPMVAEICGSRETYSDSDVQAAATLCMAKLMCVSSEYCETQLPLLMKILEGSDDAVVRSNIVIALGDMAVSFNHLIDENTDFLYRRLNDDNASVKRTCLMTLTFLILAGQVKVKGQLGEMAKCIEDSDKVISDMARMFFSELATKDNAIYNHYIDMFSLLTTDKSIDGDALKRILKFLSSFIEKDKHAKQLAEKLAARLQRCETEQQWTDVAYALSLLQHKNEDIQKVVGEGFRLVSARA